MPAIYLSVIKPTSGSPIAMTFTLTPNGSTNDTPQVYSAITPPASSSEVKIAQSLLTQLTAAILSAGNQYSGTPGLSGTTPASTFRVTRTDNVLCIWSEAYFDLDFTPVPSDTRIEQSSSPQILTLAEMTARASIHRVALEDMNGVVLSEDAQVLLLRDSCAALLTYLNNSIVATSYLDAFRGSGGRMLQGRVRPGISWDIPTARQQWQLISASLSANPKNLWNWKPRLNQLWFRMENSLMFIYDPNEIGSEVKWSYVAGYQNIPDVIKGAVMEIARKILTQTGIDRISVGSLRIESTDIEKWTGTMTRVLRKYML